MAVLAWGKRTSRRAQGWAGEKGKERVPGNRLQSNHPQPWRRPGREAMRRQTLIGEARG